MSDIGKLKPVMQTVPIRPINKDTAKKERGKKEEREDSQEYEDKNSDDHIDELI